MKKTTILSIFLSATSMYSSAQVWNVYNVNQNVYQGNLSSSSSTTNYSATNTTPSTYYSSVLSTSTDIVTNTMASSTSSTTTILLNTYIEVKDSCNFNYGGKACVSMRLLPTTSSKKVGRLRNGIVLKVSEEIRVGKYSWYKIDFRSERVKKDYRLENSYYVRSDLVNKLENLKPELYDETNPPTETNKRIIIDLAKQTLSAYEGDKLYLKTIISSGNIDNKTESGEYYVFFKTPSRYMQDDATSTKVTYFDTLSSSTKSYSTSTKGRTDYKDYFDLPGVPFDMYFDTDGKAIHGAYWHNNFGRTHSHGCINLKLADAKKLYEWSPLGISVIVK